MICLLSNAKLEGFMKVECSCAFLPSDRFHPTGGSRTIAPEENRPLDSCPRGRFPPLHKISPKKIAPTQANYPQRVL